MDVTRPRAPSRARVWIRYLARALILVLAAIGLCCLVGPPLLRLAATRLYERQITKRVYAPDRAALAEVEVTTGGATVHTVRVNLRPVGTEGWTIYQTGDSDFTPSLRWTSADTLVVGLPCDRFDHLSNPDDSQRGAHAERRLRVRFEYARACDSR